MGTIFDDSPTASPAAGARIARSARDSSRRASVLVVDDEQPMRERLRISLEQFGYRVDTAQSVDQALDLIPKLLPDVVVSDVFMPRRNGMELLAALKAEYPSIPIIMMTGHASIESAVAAMRSGASDYLTKPWNDGELQIAVERTLEHRRLDEEVNRLRGELSRTYGFENIVTKNKKMLEIFSLVRRIAETDSTVLIEGETGTGKELISQAIHYHSTRRNKAFHRVNCAAFAETLLESELFGHEKGAFTGADRRRRGIFELADGGTLMLDELENISPAMQTKVLRALEQGEFQRVGGSEVIKVHVRVIGTSNRPLADLVEEGKFREDLYYRIRVIPIYLPPLRERPEDIPLLVGHFLESSAGKANLAHAPKMDVDAVRRLTEYAWPGNVRELRNLVERLVVTTQGPRIGLDDLPPELRAQPVRRMALATDDLSAPLGEVVHRAVEEVERQYIARILEHYRGHVTRAAAHLGISRRTLYTKLDAYELHRKDFTE
jgi:DNA-binding NtrC family response regulator